MWDVRGWKRLTAHDDPQLVAARQEFLSWLAEVPESCQTVWEQRLKSNSDPPHYSVRLELFLHHYFKSAGWAVEIEPEIPESPNKPDFRVVRGKDSILVEAKAILDEQTTSQETQRLSQLADNLTNKLSRDVIIHPLSDLPPSLPTKRIRDEIEQRASGQASEVLEFDLSDTHLNTPYSLKIVILPRTSDSPEPGGVGGTVSDVHTITIAKRIRDALEQKSGKYGLVDTPFILALYVTVPLPHGARDEFDALYVDREWTIPPVGVRKSYELVKATGFFTSMWQRKRRHEDVSAVLFYRFEWRGGTHVHLAHIYHNPFAVRPLSPDLFPGVPQMVLDDGGTMKWINGEPE